MKCVPPSSCSLTPAQPTESSRSPETQHTRVEHLSLGPSQTARFAPHDSKAGPIGAMGRVARRGRERPSLLAAAQTEYRGAHREERERTNQRRGKPSCAHAIGPPAPRLIACLIALMRCKLACKVHRAGTAAAAATHWIGLATSLQSPRVVIVAVARHGLATGAQ